MRSSFKTGFNLKNRLINLFANLIAEEDTWDLHSSSREKTQSKWFKKLRIKNCSDIQIHYVLSRCIMINHYEKSNDNLEKIFTCTTKTLIENIH